MINEQRLLSGDTACSQCFIEDSSWMNELDQYFSISVCKGCGGAKIVPTGMDISQPVWLESNVVDVDKKPYPNLFFCIIKGSLALVVETSETDPNSQSYVYTMTSRDELLFRDGNEDSPVSGDQSIVFCQFESDDKDNEEVVRIEQANSLAVKTLEGWLVLTIVDNSLVAEHTYVPNVNQLRKSPFKSFRIQATQRNRMIVIPTLKSIDGGDGENKSPNLPALKRMFGRVLVKHINNALS